MLHSRRPIAYLVAAVAVVTGSLLLAFGQQRAEAVRAADRTGSAVTALTAVLDQETGLRGYLYTGRSEFLQPYLAGRAAYEQARVQVFSAASGDPQSMRLATAEDQAARDWQAYAERRITTRQAGQDSGSSGRVTEALLGKQQMDHFREVNGQLRQRLDARRDATLRRSGELATVAVVLLAGVLGLAGMLAILRSSRRAVRRGEAEIAYRGRQREFADLIQAVDSEAEAHQLVRRHLERSIEQSRATVLIRNNSDNRLQPATGVADDSVLTGQLADAEPRSCLAVRLGRGNEHGPAQADALLSCTLCSGATGATTCEPLLVAGKVIGSVLVESAGELAEPQRRALADTVAQAAPVLANLKTIAIAENRAATDALTGLPNRRAMNDSLKRMAAHAGRSGEPLAAIALDLDHFKSINDRYGHEIGDAALSAVGECLRENLRDSDFAARIGGEEFLVLAPATDAVGAQVLAEKLREALLREEVPQLPQPLTASFGVACIPTHAGGAEVLLRRADRACYLAKARGRNRVEVSSDDDATLTLTTG